MESKFKVGDVVNLIDNPSMYYVVIESILIDNGIFRRYQYEVSNIRTDDTFVYDESALEFQYHDVSWEYYLVENAKYSLPKWRGIFYNYFALCKEIGYDKDNLDRKYCEDYNNDTIPPACMQHILHDHSIHARISSIVNNNKSIIKKSIGDNDHLDLNELVLSIKRKFEYKNKDGAEIILSNGALNMGDKDYTDDEIQLIGQVDLLDKNNDHYPAYMTHFQIMQAIKEAYKNAAKTSGRRKHPEVDKRNPKAGNVPVNKGAVEYEGFSSSFNLVIRFIYNFDLDYIDTAFPIREERNAKKYNPDSYHRGRVRK